MGKHQRPFSRDFWRRVQGGDNLMLWGDWEELAIARSAVRRDHLTACDGRQASGDAAVGPRMHLAN